MTTMKVIKTESYQNTIVCRGKLVLIEATQADFDKVPFEGIKGEFVWLKKDELDGMPVNECYKPIIISETEQHPSIGYYSERTHNPIISNPTWLPDKFCKVILALPEHFSPKQLQSIVDGELKDGDEVLVECEEYHTQESVQDYIQDLRENRELLVVAHRIKLNKDNHITLFPFNKEDGWDDVIRTYFEKKDRVSMNYIEFAKYLKINYNAPTKKVI